MLGLKGWNDPEYRRELEDWSREDIELGYYKPSKFVVTWYSFLFLTPLALILWLPNSFGLILLKAFLVFWMWSIFLAAWRHEMQITLAPFLVFAGVLYGLAFSPWTIGSLVGRIAGTLLLFFFLTKLTHIQGLKKIGRKQYEGNWTRRISSFVSNIVIDVVVITIIALPAMWLAAKSL